MSKLPKEVREAIEDVHAGRSNRLQLGAQGLILTEIPNEVFLLSELEELDLSENQIRVVPERIRALAKLKELNLWQNPIEKVPDIPGLSLDWSSYLRCRQDLSPEHIVGLNIRTGQEQGSTTPIAHAEALFSEVFGLTSLRSLRIGLDGIVVQTPLNVPEPEPAIRQILDRIDKLFQLEVLLLHGLLLRTLPPGIRKLESLQVLSVIGADIEEIPEWVSELGNLRGLALRLNRLVNVPESLFMLSKLRRLYLGGNELSGIPNVVFRLQMLEHLDVSKIVRSQEQIRQVPSGILRLTYLKTLDVDNQPIEIPPPEVVEQGVEAIKNYWRQQEEVGVDYLCEAKLLIVGEPGAGKTSLARKIKNSAYALKPPGNLPRRA